MKTWLSINWKRIVISGLALAVTSVRVQAGEAAAPDPVFVRLTVLDAEQADARIRLALHVFQRPWQHFVFAGMNEPGEFTPWQFGGLPRWQDIPDESTLGVGESTPWMDWSALMDELRGGPSRSGLVFPYYHDNDMIREIRDPAKVFSFAFFDQRLGLEEGRRGNFGNMPRVRARIDFATAPGDGAIIRQIEETVEYGVLGIWTPRVKPALPDYAPLMKSIYAFTAERLEQVRAAGIEEIPPAQHIKLSTWSKVGPFAYDYRAARLEVDLLRALGMNAFKDLGISHYAHDGIKGIDPDLAEERGYRMSFFEVGGPPTEIRHPVNPNARADLREWLQRQVDFFLQYSGLERDDRIYFKVEDEQHLFGVDFGGTATSIIRDDSTAELFRDYLRRQNITPVEVGASDWASVRPFDGLRLVLQRKDFDSDAEANRYVQTVWFMQDMTARFFREFSRAGHDLLGTNTVANACIPYITWRAPWFTFTYRPDYFIWSRMGVTDMQNHHYTRNDWQTAEEMLLVGDFLRSAAKFGSEEPGVLWGLSGPSQDTIEQIGMSALIRGLYNMYEYYYSPTQWTESDVDGFWPRYLRMAQIYHLATRIEEHLLQGRSPRHEPSVAYLHSRASEIWHVPGVFPEVRMLSGALAYNQVAYDIVPEEEAAQRLDDYEVLYLVAPGLSRAAFDAVQRWVRRGGTLVTWPGSLVRDELDRPADYLRQLAGRRAAFTVLHEPEIEYNEITKLHDLPPVIRVRGPDFELETYGRTETMQIPGADVWARFEDGSPAAATFKLGRGQVIRLGFSPGTLLAKSAEPAFTNPVRHDARVYDEALLRLYLKPLELAGVQRPLVVSRTGVDATYYELPGSAVILLADYRTFDAGQVAVRVKLDGEFTRAKTMDGQPLPMEKDAEGYFIIRDIPLAVSQSVWIE